MLGYLEILKSGIMMNGIRVKMGVPVLNQAPRALSFIFTLGSLIRSIAPGYCRGSVPLGLISCMKNNFGHVKDEGDMSGRA